MASRRGSAACFTEGEMVEGQVQTWNLLLGHISSSSVDAACQLRIPDILAIHGSLTLQEIGSRLSSPPPNTDYLSRLLRFLCAKGVFSLAMRENSNGVPEPTYGLTPVSACLLLQDQTDLSLAPLALFEGSAVAHAAWHHLSDCVLHGGRAFENAHGTDLWNYMKDNPDFNKIVNNAMAGSAAIDMEAILEHYGGFGNLKTLVDVGGGIGRNISQIVAQYPTIKAINFDLPHVIAAAPSFPGVEQIGGDMFDSIPSADAIFMKSILHDWDDEHCIKLLKNCRKAIPQTGKVIIVDSVLDTDGERANPFHEVRMAMDLAMMVLNAGKERTRKNWEALLPAAGFPRYSIIELPCIQSVIEVFPAASA